MICLFCGNELIDATLSVSISISENCEFSSSRYGFRMYYYVCVNKKIAVIDRGWLPVIKKNFFTNGMFISFDSSKHREFKIDYRLFLEGGFVFDHI